MLNNNPGEWLESVLRNPHNGLPYPEGSWYMLRAHLLELIQAFPTLIIRLGTYTYPDGRAVQLLVAEGTLPMFYQYARAAPILYVVPTHDMIIKPRHSFVDPQGLVNSDYVRAWSYSRSNLVDLCHSTAMQFSTEPPLFSRPANYNPPPNLPHPSPPAQPAQQQAHPAQDELHNPLNTRPAAGGIWDAALAARQKPPTPHVTPPSTRPPSPPPATDLRDVFRNAAMAALTKRLKVTVKQENEAATAELDRLFEEQQELMRRQDTLGTAVQRMQAERRALEGCVQELSGKAVALQRWLDDNEARCPDGEVDPDVAIVAGDTWSRQALEAMAEDRAIDDLLSALDRALQDGNGALQLDVFLRQVRSQSRKQYLKRALAIKIAAKQVELTNSYQATSARANFANPLSRRG